MATYVTDYFFSSSKEEDEKERLSQVKELHEEDLGDNTEPLEDLFLGLSVEEVGASCNAVCPSGRTSGSSGRLVFPFSNAVLIMEPSLLSLCVTN